MKKLFITLSIIGVGIFCLANTTLAAIGYGTSSPATSYANGTSLTYAFTPTATANTLLEVQVLILNSDVDLVTGVTYNGSALTRVKSSYNAANPSTLYMYALPISTPDGNAHNVVVSASSTTDIYSNAVTYTGVKQERPEASAEVNGTNRATSTISVTTITDNAWVVGFFRHSAASGDAGVGTYIRSTTFTDKLVEYSSNPKTPAGSTILNMININGNAAWSDLFIVASIAPAPEPPPVVNPMQIIWWN